LVSFHQLLQMGVQSYMYPTNNKVTSCKITKVRHILDRSIAYLSGKKRQQSLDRLQSCNLAKPGMTVQSRNKMLLES
jgi:hypothetical protein